MADSRDQIGSTPWFPARSVTALPSAVESALAATVATLPASAVPIDGWRGARLTFVSNGLNDETATATVYGIDRFFNNQDDTSAGFRVESLGTLDITLSTVTAVLNTVLPASQTAALPFNTTWRYPDTMVWTSSTFGTYRLTNLGAQAAAFSPTLNATIAEFNISDLGGFSHIAVVITTYGLTATSKVMPLLKLINHIGD